MRIASLVAVSLLPLWTRHAASSLSGVWALDQERSDFGTLSEPEQFLLRLQQTDSHLAIWRITSDSDGQHLTYQECSVDRSYGAKEVGGPPSSEIVLSIISTQGMQEQWRFTPAEELIIVRSINMGLKTVRQRLVLKRACAVFVGAEGGAVTRGHVLAHEEGEKPPGTDF